jgi:SpoVK/Ycf46/Vps4 family AAA+-type ATPase
MKKEVKNTTGRIYEDNYRHLEDELQKLDLLILRRVMRMRQEISKMKEITQDPRLFVSHEEVDHLLNPTSTVRDRLPELAEVDGHIEKLQQDINKALDASMAAGVFLALPQLAILFGLSAFELQAVIICLVPELRRKYDKLFVYLQDDIARKKPSVHLVLDLLCRSEAEQWQALRYFTPNSPLFRFGILQVSDDPYSPSGSSHLARFLQIRPRILNFILGNRGIDGSLSAVTELYKLPVSRDDLFIAPDTVGLAMDIADRYIANSPAAPKKLVLYFYGPHGVGKHDLALAMCRKLGCLLLHLDMEVAAGSGSSAAELLRTAFRECLLQQAMLYIDKVDCLLADDSRSRVLLKTLARLSEEFGWLTIMAGETAWTPAGLFRRAVFHSIRFTVPPVQIRQKAWQHALLSKIESDEKHSERETGEWAGELARQFNLTPGQIREAVEYAHFRYPANSRDKTFTLSHLYAAARHQSNRKLVELAVKIEPKQGWEDIVLPEEKVQQLKEICSQVKHRHLVFNQWGFKEKLSHGRGLSVLFSGSPGTGKTLAAEVMAGELQLDLYKIDLSGVVSKYIGETEKNLSRVFREAETSNAILFFDEADALFGKRTDVSDAHDRYANIETSYLLQKMEEYEGIVILATNLRKNMDEAFTRRIRFIVEFPFPNEESRSRIWRAHFPEAAPVSSTIDYEYLARQFPLSGGSIRNIVLNAAFFAAQNGGTIDMEHILNGARREFEKVGKLWRNLNPAASTGKC